MTLRISKQKYEIALVGLNGQEVDTVRGLVNINGTSGFVSFDLVSQFPRKFLENLDKLEELGRLQREKIKMFLDGQDNPLVYMDLPNDTIRDLLDKIDILFSKQFKSSFEVLFLGHWYKAEMSINTWRPSQYQESYGFSITMSSSLIDMKIELKELYVIESNFIAGESINDILKKNNIRYQEIEESTYKSKIDYARSVQSQVGLFLRAKGKALMKHKFFWWDDIEEVEFGSKLKPQKVIVEPELETKDKDRYHEKQNILGVPIIRVFSLELKKYVYVDVDDLIDYDWDQKAEEKLILPERIKSALNKMFHTDLSLMFGDLVSGKSGGLIIGAIGGPGVGKTLTAEIFSEYTERPLYIIEIAELGTDLASIESNLNRIFIRSRRWNCILLFDEIDVFLSERGEDLNKSAIVSIFLRLMDYFNGLLFITTNRPEVLDKAFKSRVTLWLKYPELDKETRTNIWSIMLKEAGIRVPDNHIERLGQFNFNGRQIRNITRLVKIFNSSVESKEEIVHGEKISYIELPIDKIVETLEFYQEHNKHE